MVDRSGKKFPKGITQRKDGRYMGRFEYAGDKYTVYGKSLQEVKKKLEDKRYETEHGLYSKETNITVQAWFEIWIIEYKSMSVKRGTIVAYRNAYKTYVDKSIGKRKLKDVRAEHIQKIYNDMHQKGYKRSTIETVSIVLGGMFKQAMKNEMIMKNPVGLATLPKETTKIERRVLNQEEQRIFLNYAKDSQYAPIFEFALSTGMRGGEIRALTWDCIDFTGKMIHVKSTLKKEAGRFYIDTPKTMSSYRDIPILDNVLRILKKQRLWQSEKKLQLGAEWKCCEGLEQLVFTTNVGTPIDKEYLKNSIDGTVARINADGIKFEHLSMHTFRHSFATRCIEEGMNPQTLKAILGHSKLATTMDLYAHVLPDTKAQEMQKIANLF